MPGYIKNSKYLVAIVILCVLAIFVSQQNKRLLEQCVAAKDSGKCEEQAKLAFPRWYRLLAWPECTQNWALLLTLLAIAEQTNQTSRSADISVRTLVAQFRPKIVVRKIRLDPSSFVYYDRRGDGEWFVVIEFANVGGTSATIRRGTAWF
jgi:hypothetical protein